MRTLTTTASPALASSRAGGTHTRTFHPPDTPCLHPPRSLLNLKAIIFINKHHQAPHHEHLNPSSYRNHPRFATMARKSHARSSSQSATSTKTLPLSAA